MIITYENLLTLSHFKLKSCKKLCRLNSAHFLSFTDALHYLINAYKLENKKILIPAFYCDVVIKDIESHKLNVKLCRIDRKNFDVDIGDFINQLEIEQPDIVLIYNFFGKNSHLYNDLNWTNLLKKDAIIISDLAHSLLPNHNIVFLNKKHFYIDSTRKTTSQMMANLIMPPSIRINKSLISSRYTFRIILRVIFLIKSWSLRIAVALNSQLFSKIGMKLYIYHDKYIGAPKFAFKAFWWDRLFYNHINFEKIKKNRRNLYREYNTRLTPLSEQGHIELFKLSDIEKENICFFFIRIINPIQTTPIITLLQKHGFWAEVLWDFDRIKDITTSDKDWAKSIIVMPFTLSTKAEHVQSMVSLMEKFFTTSTKGIANDAE